MYYTPIKQGQNSRPDRTPEPAQQRPQRNVQNVRPYNNNREAQKAKIQLKSDQIRQEYEQLQRKRGELQRMRDEYEKALKARQAKNQQRNIEKQAQNQQKQVERPPQKAEKSQKVQNAQKSQKSQTQSRKPKSKLNGLLKGSDPMRKTMQVHKTLHNKRCVCQICDCKKRHVCPKGRKRYPLDLNTEYGQKYPRHQQNCRQRLIRPKQNDWMNRSAIIPGKSVYQSDYSPMKCGRRRPCRPGRGHKFFGDDCEPYKTQYQREHDRKKGQPSQMIRPVTKKAPEKKFEAKSTYQTHYIPRDRSFSPSVNKLKNQSSIMPESDERFLTTSYQKHYTKKSNPVQRYKGKSSNTKDRICGNDKSANFGTTYRKHYNHKEIQKRHQCALFDLPPCPSQMESDCSHVHYQGDQDCWMFKAPQAQKTE